MNEDDICGRIDALRSLRGDGKPANTRREVSADDRLWILLDPSSKVAQRAIEKHRDDTDGDTPVALLDLLEVDEASMADVFGEKWILKFTKSEWDLRCGGDAYANDGGWARRALWTRDKRGIDVGFALAELESPSSRATAA